LKEGLQILSAEQKLKKPIPRIAEGRVLAKSGMVTSCMDISDGLSSSLYELMRAGGNGFEINSSSVPVHESLTEMEMGDNDRIIVALNSGDEYELLFTVRPDSVSELRRLLKNATGREFIDIGYVTANKDVLLRKGQAKERIDDLGFEHFR